MEKVKWKIEDFEHSEIPTSREKNNDKWRRFSWLVGWCEALSECRWFEDNKIHFKQNNLVNQKFDFGFTRLADLSLKGDCFSR